jgi:deazaflavin-dependent oxidoreductase (nitroreductase family)
MWRRLGQLGGGLLVGLGVIGIVVMVGMRRNSPVVLNAVRRTGRAIKPLVLKSSGTRGGIASVVQHVGRRSGRSYETPVNAVPTDDGFVIALPYGLNTDWLKNVLASGSANIVHEGGTYEVDRPEIVPTAIAEPLFSAKAQRTHRRFRVEQYLLVRSATDPAEEHVVDPPGGGGRLSG